MALILLPVCRNTITWLRNKTKLGAFVPFDNNITFHKVIFFGLIFCWRPWKGLHLKVTYKKKLSTFLLKVTSWHTEKGIEKVKTDKQDKPYQDVKILNVTTPKSRSFFLL